MVSEEFRAFADARGRIDLLGVDRVGRVDLCSTCSRFPDARGRPAPAPEDECRV
jgi:hypothetical protein